MSKDEIFKRVSSILEVNFGIEAARVQLDSKLGEDLDIDSIDAVDLIVQLKPLLGGNMKPEAFKTVRTVGDVVDAVYGMMRPVADAPSGA
jgi:acyl carrier protein